MSWTPDDAPNFVGRDALLARLLEAIDQPGSIVTLIGLGGVGKTRLALEGLQRLTNAEPPYDAVLATMADMAPDGDFIARVAQSLEIDLQPKNEDPVSTIGIWLDRQRVDLLVLDNVEQLASRLEAPLQKWRALAPNCRFLLTSRERLPNSLGSDIEVPTLDCPRLDASPDELITSPATRLFLEIADRRGRRPRDDADLGWVANIVRSLEGLPLAIELAASRVGLLSLLELSRQLDESVLRLCTGGHGLPERHRTLTATLEWSWSRLSGAEQRALAAISVFRGGFTVTHAAAILGENDAQTLSLLEALNAKCLIRRIANTGRLDIPVQIREFAESRLEPDAPVRARHRTYFAALADRWRREFSDHVQRQLVVVSEEKGNLETVIESADGSRGGELEEAIRALLILYTTARIRGPLKSYARRVDSAMAAPAYPDVDERLRAELHCVHAGILMQSGKWVERDTELARSLALAEATQCTETKAKVFLDAAMIFMAAGEFEKATDLFERALKLAKARSDHVVSARILTNLGSLLMEKADFEAARSHFERAYAIFKEAGEVRLQGCVLHNLGTLLVNEGRSEDARDFFCRAAIHLADAEDNHYRAFSIAMRGVVDHLAGRFNDARTAYEDAIDRLHRFGDRQFEAYARGYLGAVLADLGETGRAEEELAYAGGWVALSGDRPGQAKISLHKGHLDIAAANEAKASSDSTRSEDFRRRALQRLEESKQLEGEKLRFARRLLRRALAADAGSERSEAITVANNGETVELPSGRSVDMSRRLTLRRVLQALATGRRDFPGECIEISDLFAAGWPGENIRLESATNRVRVAIATLRGLGFREYLLTGDDGYYLDPLVDVIDN